MEISRLLTVLSETKFKLVSVTFYLEAINTIELPVFKGFLLRGAFGKIFRGIVCLQRQERCESCKMARSCPYLYLFESPQFQDSEHQWKTSYEPHPFVLEPPLDNKRVYLPGDVFKVGLVLIGEGISYLPYFILVFEEMGIKGIGREKGRFCIKKVTSTDTNGEHEIYHGNSKSLHDDIAIITPGAINKQIEKGTTKIAIDIITPARLQQRGKFVSYIEFTLLIRALLRRYSWLSTLYCHEAPFLPYDQLLEHAKKEVRPVRSNLAWQGWEHYSFRQQQRMKLGGVVGRIIFNGDLEPFLLLLKLGEYLHIGKGTAFGLGKYKMTSLDG